MERNQNIWTNLGKSFKTELETIVKQILAKHGVKPGSDIGDSIEFTDNSRNLLFMYVNSYWQDLDKGRKPGKRKIPIAALIQFIKKNNISNTKRNTTQIAYAMQNSIYKQGIRGKNFIKTVEGAITDHVELRIADTLEQDIADQLIKSFKIK